MFQWLRKLLETNSASEAADSQRHTSAVEQAVGENGAVGFRMRQVPEAFVDGEGYWSENNIERVKELKRNGDLAEAEKLLKRMVAATKSESAQLELGVAPWPFEQLAIVLRKQRKYEEEIELLRDFAAQKHAPGVKPQKLIERLEKAERANETRTRG